MHYKNKQIIYLYVSLQFRNDQLSRLDGCLVCISLLQHEIYIQYMQNVNKVIKFEKQLEDLKGKLRSLSFKIEVGEVIYYPKRSIM